MNGLREIEAVDRVMVEEENDRDLELWKNAVGKFLKKNKKTNFINV